MNILILDDMEERHDAFREKFKNIECNIIHVTTAKECIEALKNNTFDLICLDHDLGGKETGHEVSKWIADNKNTHPMDKTKIIIHSYNPVGAIYIFQELRDVNIYSYIKPGYWKTSEML